jgi:hypothetical protein
MNLAKSKVILKKINTLHENILLSGSMSKIEKDLFIDYVKELYELVLEEEESSDHSNSGKWSEEKVAEVEIERKVVDDIRNTSSHQVQELPKEAPKYQQVEAQAPPRNGNGYASNALKEIPVETVKKPEKSIDPAIESLFTDDSIEHSSYRFSQSPISDISKGMGINEKILTINQLFNRDQQEFNYIATKLNYFNTFSEACSYLKTEVAPKFDWASETNRAKAIDFIRLVRRKYSS